jgi:enoyl-CoA hydratase/carnithine racemase
MRWSYVTIDRQGPVAVVRFDRKENLNAFNQQLVRELTEAARTFHDDLDTHAVVLAGADEAFSAGADLKDAASWQLADKTDMQRRHRFYAGVRLCRAWEEMPRITIAAMERMAVGAGVAIALACDWRVLGAAPSSMCPRSRSVSTCSGARCHVWSRWSGRHGPSASR